MSELLKIDNVAVEFHARKGLLSSTKVQALDGVSIQLDKGETLALVGESGSGKTTVFNALTRKTAETAAFSSGRFEPNLASVKVPDPRLDVLADIYKPRKLTAAEVQYVDVSGFKGEEQGTELSAEILGYIGTADALLHVLKPITSDIIEKSPKLKLIQKIGVGVNTIDLEAARAQGVQVGDGLHACGAAAQLSQSLWAT